MVLKYWLDKVVVYRNQYIQNIIELIMYNIHFKRIFIDKTDLKNIEVPNRMWINVVVHRERKNHLRSRIWENDNFIPRKATCYNRSGGGGGWSIIRPPAYIYITLPSCLSPYVFPEHWLICVFFKREKEGGTITGKILGVSPHWHAECIQRGETESHAMGCP